MEPKLIDNPFETGPMPDYSVIPDEFKGMNAHYKKTDAAKWIQWQEKWFFKGLESFPDIKEGFDKKAVISHLRSIQASFEPKHEVKMATVAYLASLWLEPYWEEGKK